MTVLTFATSDIVKGRAHISQGEHQLKVTMFLVRLIVKSTLSEVRRHSLLNTYVCSSSRLYAIFFGSKQNENNQDFFPSLPSSHPRIVLLAYLPTGGNFVSVCSELNQSLITHSGSLTYRRCMNFDFEERDSGGGTDGRTDGELRSRLFGKPARTGYWSYLGSVKCFLSMAAWYTENTHFVLILENILG